MLTFFTVWYLYDFISLSLDLFPLSLNFFFFLSVLQPLFKTRSDPHSLLILLLSLIWSSLSHLISSSFYVLQLCFQISTPLSLDFQFFWFKISFVKKIKKLEILYYQSCDQKISSLLKKKKWWWEGFGFMGFGWLCFGFLIWEDFGFWWWLWWG